MHSAAAIDREAKKAHRAPSEAQKESGNYRKGHVRVQGLDIAIENARGSLRKGVDRDGKPWQVKMPAHYGYLKRTEGADGDHVDVYLGPSPGAPRVFVVDQVDAESGEFDEHKAFIGFGNKQQALATYRQAFSDGRANDRMGGIRDMSMDAFKRWLVTGDQTRPIARAAGGRVEMQTGGGLPGGSFDPDAYLAAPAAGFDPDAYLGAAPDWSLSRSVTDIPSEIARTAGRNWETIKEGFAPEGGRAEQGTIGGILATGKALAAIPALAMSPITGTARSLIGHPMAAATHAIGELINPEVAARDNPQKMFEDSADRVETAISAIMPRNFGRIPPARVTTTAPAPSGGATTIAITPKPTYGIKSDIPKKIVPSTDQLLEASDTSYKVARSLPIEIHPKSLSDLSGQIVKTLESPRYGFRKITTPQTFGIIEELTKPLERKAFATISDLDSVRSALRHVSPGPERKAADKAIRLIDDYLVSVDPIDVVSGAHLLPELRKEIGTARGNWAAGKRAEMLEAREEAALDAAGSSGSGANVNNAIRQKLRSILAPTKEGERLRRGFTKDELEQMRRAVRGTVTGNVTRMLGKLAPTGVVSAWPTVAAFFSGVDPTGVITPSVGFAAKALSEASTRRQLQKLLNMTKARSPLGQVVPPITTPKPSAAYPFIAPGLLTSPYALPQEPIP